MQNYWFIIFSSPKTIFCYSIGGRDPQVEDH